MTEADSISIADESRIDVPIDIALNEELDSEGALGPDVEAKGFRVSVANQPIGFRVRDLFEKLGKPAPNSLDLYSRFDLFMVPHTLAVMRSSGMAEPTSIGIDVEYLAEGMTCSVVALFPVFQYAIRGSASGGVKFAAKISPVGELSLTDGKGGDSSRSINIGGLELSASTDSSLELKVSAVVSTPSVQTSGKNSSQCSWTFEKDKEPLFGRDIETWAWIVMPKGVKELKYRARFFVVTRTFLIPTRTESKWIDRTCKFI